ncbi:TRAP transporter large permease [Roseomonas sp. CCTCC AB2023176]|uniref:TRAP transporter large permease n=1 Tax=Roseomonas sp. CCTCC AB2023176 TaxID=3342640 RepID=UPI0035DCDB5D
MTAALVALPLAMLVAGFPVFLVLLAAATAYAIFIADVPATVLHQTMFGGVDSFALLSIPFFLFAGEVMTQGGIARRIVDLVVAVVGRLPGSLALATVGTSTIVGAISGSSAAATATVGRILYVPLQKAGYTRPFATGVIAASAGIDVVIPPSIAMILYGVVAEVSVPKLFLAGIVPGLVLAGFMAVFIIIHAAVTRVGGTTPFSLALVIRAFIRSLWALGMPTIVFAGIYGGVFSPTEAAGIACVYAAAVSAMVYRDIGPRALLRLAADAMVLTAQIMVIVAAAGVFAWMLTTSGTPARLVGWIEGLDLSPWQVLLVINIVLLIAGCFIDPTSAILVLTPLLMPIVRHAGIDPVHFGIVMTVNLSIGMFTPPFGLNLFVMQSLFRVPTGDLYRGVMPFIAVQISALAAITYIPALSLWLAGG